MTADPAAERAGVLVETWLRLWNGDLSLARHIIGTDFVVHAALIDGGDDARLDGPDGLAAWVGQIRAIVPDLTFRVDVGCMPGAQAQAGTAVSMTGTDILPTVDGRLAEYWVNSDTLQLLTQLQAR